MEELRTRVQRGAALLDQVKPNWRKKLLQSLEGDLNNLRMYSCSACVLGRLYGGFWEGSVEILEFIKSENISCFDEEDCGFNISGAAQREWDTLRDLWRVCGFNIPGATREEWDTLRDLWLDEIYQSHEIELGESGA